jgi:putative mRNA 3-end processing factor
MGYALGKIQRILKNVQVEGPVYAHGAVYSVNERLREAGFDLPSLELITKETDRKKLAGAFILAPPGAEGSPWIRKFPPLSVGYCSGWMRIRGIKNRRAIDQGFVLSDHIDWDQLNQTVMETGAEKVYVTHGFTSVFAKWLTEKGIDAAEVKTMYGDEKDEVLEGNETENTATS